MNNDINSIENGNSAASVSGASVNMDQEIDLKDILVYCFLHWRSALCLVILVGLLFGGYKGYKTYKSLNETNAAFDRYDKAVADGITDKTELEKIVNNSAVMTNIENREKADSLREQIESLQEDIEDKQKYLDEAEIMQIDPNKESYSTLTVVVSTQNDKLQNSMTALLQAYRNNLLSISSISAISEATGIEEAYVNDLISISMNAGKTSIDNASAMGETGTITISCVGNNIDNTEKMVEVLRNETNSIRDDIQSTFGEHIVEFMPVVSNVRRDISIMNTKTDANNMITTSQQDIDSTQKILSTITYSGKVDGVKKAALKTAVKKGITGSLVVFLMYGFLLCVRYALAKTAFTKTQFLSRFNVNIIGAFAGAKESLYKRNGRFDKWLRAVAGIGEKPENKTSVYDMVAVNLKLFAGDAKNIVVSGSASADDKVKLIVELRSHYPEIAFQPCESIISSAEDRAKLASADGIIFFEKYGLMKYADLEHEIGLASGARVDVIGCVME